MLPIVWARLSFPARSRKRVIHSEKPFRKKNFVLPRKRVCESLIFWRGRFEQYSKKKKCFVTGVIAGKVFDESAVGGGITFYDKTRSKHYIVGVISKYNHYVPKNTVLTKVKNLMDWIRDNLKVIHIQKRFEWEMKVILINKCNI